MGAGQGVGRETIDNNTKAFGHGCSLVGGFVDGDDALRIVAAWTGVMYKPDVRAG